MVLFREYVEGLRETMEILDEGGLCLGLDSKMDPPQYETSAVCLSQWLTYIFI